MLSPLMAEFIPDYSDIVDLDDAEPLEGPDLVQYQTSIAEKVDEINRLGMPDNQPCNLIDYFDRNKDIKEKVERITMAVKEQDGVLYGCANLTLRESLTPEEYRVVGQYLRGQYSDGWGESLEQREIKVDGGELYLHFYVGAGSDFQIQVKAPENEMQEQQPKPNPSRPKLKLLGHDGNIFSILGDASRLLRCAGMSEQANEMADRVHKSGNYYEACLLYTSHREPAGDRRGRLGRYGKDDCPNTGETAEKGSEVMPIKEKIEVEMLSPLMAEFIPDYSDIVDLDDAEPLEGPDLVQYQPSIAEKVDEINRLGMPDNQPCNLIDYFNRNKDIKEKVERITMAVKEQDGVLYGCANLTLRENLTPEEYRVVGQYLRGQYSDGWEESLEQREIKVDGLSLIHISPRSRTSSKNWL